MASLLAWLAYDGARTSTGAAVASGKAWFFQPGTTSTQAVVYSDADGLYAITQPVDLDAAGRAVVYTNSIVQCEVQTAAGATVRLSDRANAVQASQVEIQNTVATGTSLTTGSQVEGGRTDLDVYLSSMRTSFGAPDGYVDMAGTPVLLKNAIRVLTHWFDVTVAPYGAAGDGTTDDTTAIQRAITAANSSGGGVVFFPPGTFLVSSLTLPANVSLIGCGGGKSIVATESTSAVLLVASGAFAAYGIKFQSEERGILRYTVGVDQITVFTSCSFEFQGVTGDVFTGTPTTGPVNFIEFTGCDFLLTSATSANAIFSAGCTVHGGYVEFAGGSLATNGQNAFSGVFISYTGVGTKALCAQGASVTFDGCEFDTVGGGTLTLGGDINREWNSAFGGATISFTRRMALSGIRESSSLATSTSATSYTPNFLRYRAHMVTSSGASFAWGAHADAETNYDGLTVELWYKNTNGGAITPTFDAGTYKATAVSVASGSACGWLLRWSTEVSRWVQISISGAYAA